MGGEAGGAWLSVVFFFPAGSSASGMLFFLSFLFLFLFLFLFSLLSAGNRVNLSVLGQIFFLFPFPLMEKEQKTEP